MSTSSASGPAIRPVDRQRWKPGVLVTYRGKTLFVEPLRPAIAAADAALRYMMSGEIPPSAGLNSRITSMALQHLAECGPAATGASMVVYIQGQAHPIRPYRYSLAEVRARRAELRR